MPRLLFSIQVCLPNGFEQLLVKPIEDQIKQITEIKTIHSLSMEGMAIITPEAHDRYTQMQPIWSDLRNKMNDMAGNLPQGTIGPIVNDDFGRLSVITLALTGDEFTMIELEDVAKDISDELGGLSLVAKVGATRCFRTSGSGWNLTRIICDSLACLPTALYQPFKARILYCQEVSVEADGTAHQYRTFRRFPVY